MLIASLLVACDRPSLPDPSAKNELIVVTRASPTTLYAGANGETAGLEYELCLLFGKFLGVPVRFITVDSPAAVYQTLRSGKVHLAAAGLYRESDTYRDLLYGAPYHEVQPVLVYNDNEFKPRDWLDVVERGVGVVHGSGQEKWLMAAKEKFNQLSWQSFAVNDADALLEKVAQQEINYAVVDSHQFAVSKNYYLDIERAFSVAPPQQLAWAFTAGQKQLLQRAEAFFDRIRQDGSLQRLLDRYYGHLERVTANDAEAFQDKLRSLLPTYRSLFQQAQERTGIDWRLIAAIAYQESHWDPLATSPTNVRGMMMLTEETAQRFKVNDRLDAKQSIFAGAQYLVELKKNLPARIAEPDRTWIALSAYNIGYGHLEGGRILTQKRKLNPDSWTDLKKALPLLAKPEYAATLKHGGARGGEAVIFVENVRAYYDILLRFEPLYLPRLRVRA